MATHMEEEVLWSAWPEPSETPGAHLGPLIARYAPISLQEMGDVALASRVDVKFLLGEPQLGDLLAALAPDYRMLDVDGVRLNRYRSLYFDTADLALYASHHKGHGERFKVRSRIYLDSGVSYLEVKHRTGKGRTLKSRMRTRRLLTQLTPEAIRFVDEVAPLNAVSLRPALWNDFTRLTLVSDAQRERVTLDLGVRFDADGRAVHLARLVVAELKQESPERDSPLLARMRALEVRPTGFSKYCVGTALLHPEVQHSRFQRLRRRLDEIARGGEP